MEKKFLRSEENSLQFFSGTILISVLCPFSQGDAQYILHISRSNSIKWASEGRTEANNSSKIGRGNDLTGKGWTPTVPEQV